MLHRASDLDNFFGSGYGPAGPCEHDNETSDSIKRGECLD